ncbi:FAD-binding oxidoreductase [bacterium]|nr:FAD-binding oxidoreductase [bacterium]
MQRRTFLKGLGAVIAILPDVLRPRLVRGATARRATSRLLPSDPAWPNPKKWEQLSKQVDGNLIRVEPLFGPCNPESKAAACQDVVNNLKNPFYLGDQPAGTQVSGWLDAWTPAASVYAVRARNTGDVVAAVNFARENNLRLVVKGGAHSYQGTSNAPDSLLVWTRSMNRVTLHEAFVPKGCEGKIAPEPAVTTEAGAVWADLYDAVIVKGGRYVQGGGCTSVGVAGLVQSGGFGSFSKGFGTAAASLLEAEIVTADGQIRIANECMNPDLFWAIKGGGGGSWGIVTKLTLRTHELPKFAGVIGGTIRASSDAAFHRLISRFIAFYKESLLNPHWGESVKVGSNTLEISMLYQGNDNAEPQRTWQPFAEWVKKEQDSLTILEEIDSSTIEMRSLWDVPARRKRGSNAMVYDTRPGAPETHGWWRGDQEQVGVFIHGYESLWMPESLLGSDTQPKFVDALLAAGRHNVIELHFNKGLAGATTEVLAAARNTATNPVVLQSFALAITARAGAPRFPGQQGASMDLDAAKRNARSVDAAIAELRRIVLDGGSYVSESNYFHPSWQHAFWGNHYPKLRAVKDRYDPDGLFFVHHGVGSEDWSPDGLLRLN